jgi:hypothetical protein
MADRWNLSYVPRSGYNVPRSGYTPPSQRIGFMGELRERAVQGHGQGGVQAD